MSDPIEEFEEEIAEEKECKLCNIALAGIGLLIAGLFAYMSIDVLSGGKLTSALGLGTAHELEE